MTNHFYQTSFDDDSPLLLAIYINPCFIDYLPSSPNENHNKSNTAELTPNSSRDNTRSTAGTSILVRPPRSNDFSRIHADNMEYSLEAIPNDSTARNFEDPTDDNSSIHTDESVRVYHEVRGIRMPITIGRSEFQSPTSSTMVEIPIQILPASPTITSGSPQHHQPGGIGLSFTDGTSNQGSPNIEGNGNRDQEEIEINGEERNTQGAGGNSPPFNADVRIEPLDMHILHIHAHHEQRHVHYRLGSSVPHLTADFINDQDGTHIRVWYYPPPYTPDNP